MVGETARRANHVPIAAPPSMSADVARNPFVGSLLIRALIEQGHEPGRTTIPLWSVSL
jgi:hypothetical protein